MRWIRPIATAALAATLTVACGDHVAGESAGADAGTDASAVDGGAGDDAAADASASIDGGPAGDEAAEPEPFDWPPPTDTYDFVVTAFAFHTPDGLVEGDARVANPCAREGATNNDRYTPLELDGLEVDGFDLDGVDGQGDGPCGHTDYVSASGETGVDYGFLHVMDMIRPARPGQTIETVLASAPSQGLVRIGIRISGVDDLVDDDEVRLLFTNIAETPLLGGDGQPLAGGSVPALNDTRFQSEMYGEIVDGVLYAGPADVSMGHINLLVVEDRVVTLRDARVRATVSERSTGGLEVDGLIAGWWERESMIEAMGQAILAIGSNRGELECVLDGYSDHSTDGETCNAISTMLSVEAVSGFITRLVDPFEGD